MERRGGEECGAADPGKGCGLCIANHCPIAPLLFLKVRALTSRNSRRGNRTRTLIVQNCPCSVLTNTPGIEVRRNGGASMPGKPTHGEPCNVEG